MGPLRPRDELMARVYAAGGSVKEAARAAGMTVRSARYRKQRADLRARVSALVAETTARSVALAAFAALPAEVRAEVARLLMYPAARPAGPG